MSEQTNTLMTLLYVGIGLGVGGLIVGSIFASAVPTFTNAFSGLNTTNTNITASIGAIANIVPIAWILGFLLLFLVVGIGAIGIKMRG